MHEVKHPIWGSNIALQLSADDVHEDGGHKMVKVRGLFGGEKMKKREVDGFNRPATDDDSTERYFRHFCGLLKIVMTSGRNGPLFVVFLDGHVTSNFDSHEIEFRFAPKELAANDGKPTAEVWFSSTGKRWGPFSDYGASRIVCTFTDEEQMDQYLDVTNRRMPKSITYKGVTYSATSSGYQSSDGSTLLSPLLAYLLLAPNEREAFAEQHPDVQEFVGDGGDFGGAGAGDSFGPDENSPADTDSSNQAPASAVVYDDEDKLGDGSSDFDSSSPDSGGSSYNPESS